MKRRTRILFSSLRAALLIGAAGLGIYAVTRDTSGFIDALRTIGLTNALLSLILTIGGLFALAEAWQNAVCSLAGPLGTRRESQRIYFVSQLGKYVPGGVWTVVSQVERAGVYGLSLSRMGIGALLFIFMVAATGALVALGLVPWTSPELMAEYGWLLWLGPIGIVLLFPRVLTWCINLVLTKLLKRSPMANALSPRDIWIPAAWIAVAWTAFGAGVLALVTPLSGTGPTGVLLATTTGTFALAWVVGMIVVFAPAGIGPRDLVIFVALSPLLGASAATSTAIALRVLHTLADLLLALCAGQPWKSARSTHVPQQED